MKKKIKTLPRVRRAGAREKLPIFFKIELKKANRQQCAHFWKSQKMKIPPTLLLTRLEIPQNCSLVPWSCSNSSQLINSRREKENRELIRNWTSWRVKPVLILGLQDSLDSNTILRYLINYFVFFCPRKAKTKLSLKNVERSLMQVLNH